VGVLTRRDLLDPTVQESARVRELVRRPVAVIFESSTCREAADHMVREGVGRLVVVSEGDPGRPRGIVTRSDLLEAHERRLEAARPQAPVLVPRRPRSRAVLE